MSRMPTGMGLAASLSGGKHTAGESTWLRYEALLAQQYLNLVVLCKPTIWHLVALGILQTGGLEVS